MRDTASVIVRSSSLTGLASLVLVTFATQPGCGLMLTDARGVSLGKDTARPVVLAVGDSVGTRKVSLVNPPASASRGLTLTCADAGPASRTDPASRARVAPAVPVAVRWTGRRDGVRAERNADWNMIEPLGREWRMVWSACAAAHHPPRLVRRRRPERGE